MATISRIVIAVLAVISLALAAVVFIDLGKTITVSNEALPTPEPIGKYFVAVEASSGGESSVASVEPDASHGRSTAEPSDADAKAHKSESTQTSFVDDVCPECPYTTAVLTDFLVGSDGSRDDHFGAAADVDGDTMVVGAPQGWETGAGKAYVFERDAADPENWLQTAILSASDGEFGDAFGRDAAIDGDTLAIGSRYSTIRGHALQGRVHIYERDEQAEGGWRAAAVIDSGEAGPGDEFGMGIALQGDTLVISAPRGDIGGSEDQGKAYVFERDHSSENGWGPVQMLAASDGAPGDIFGRTVTMYGDPLVIGAWGADVEGRENQGKAYVYERTGGASPAWSESQILVGEKGYAGDGFGRLVDMDGDTLVLSASGYRDATGRAYIFERKPEISNEWTETKALYASDGAPGDALGMSVAVDADIVAVGATSADVRGMANQGRTYMFERDHGGKDKWRELQSIYTPDGMVLDLFGWDAAIDDDTLVATANFANLGAQENQGKAYVYRLYHRKDWQHEFEQRIVASATESASRGAAGESNTELPDHGGGGHQTSAPDDNRSSAFVARENAPLSETDTDDYVARRSVKPSLVASGADGAISADFSGRVVVYAATGTEPLEFVTKSQRLDSAPDKLAMSDGYVYAVRYSEHQSPTRHRTVSVLAIDPLSGAEEIGEIVAPAGDPADISVADGHLYVAARSGGLHVFDVSPPTSAALIRSLPLTNAVGVDVIGTSAVVVDQGDGYDRGRVRLIDVSKPAKMRELDSITIPGVPRSIRTNGRRAYVLTENDVVVLDVSDQAAGISKIGRYHVDRYHVPTDALGLDNTVFIGASGTYGEPGLRVVAMDDRGRITAHRPITVAGGVQSLALTGQQLVAATPSGLTSFDLSGLSDFDDIGAITQISGSEASRSWPEMGTAVGTTVYLADFYAGLRIVDAADPAHPATRATIGSPTGAVGVTDDIAYVGGRNTLHVIDVSNASAPVAIRPADGLDDLYIQPSFPNAIVVSGGHAYAGGGGPGLSVVDIRDPRHLKEVSRLRLADVQELAVTETTLFVGSEGGRGFRVYDVSDPSSPSWIGLLELDIHAMAIEGNYAYLATPIGLGVVDVSEPSRPAFVSNIATGDWYGDRYVGIVHKEDVLYALREFSGLHVYDVSTPTSPRQIGSFDSVPSYSLDLFGGEGTTLYVVYGHGGLQVLDVSDPSAPVEVGRLEGPG